MLAALGDTAETGRRIALAQKAAPLREGNETATVALPVAAVRRIGLEVGRRLVERGLLDDVDHVFDLEIDEALATLTGGPGSLPTRPRWPRERNADAHVGPARAAQDLRRPRSRPPT